MQSLLRSEWAQGFLRKHWGKLLILQAVVFVGLGFMLASGGGLEPPVGNAIASTQVAGPSMWTCSMHPQIRSSNPGKCPICGMDLIPVASSSGGMRTLTVSPAAKALMSIQTSVVERRYVLHEIPMVGKVAYDETKIGYITAWVPGRLDRLYVDFTGVEVKKGDHMVYIYSEQLYAAQEELIQALKYAAERSQQPGRIATSGIDLVASSREKLRLLGLQEEQIEQIETQSKPTDHLTIYAPLGGIVVEKLKQEGERVSLGDRIYTIVDLEQVWVHLDAYESDVSWIRYGQEVTITTESYPGDEFHGRIAFIQRVLNDKTRTVKVRVNVPNTSGKLKPEMFVRATVRPKVAAGGRVMDPDLAGKWISPMHPEIVKDEPGTCDICGMPLVRAESLGYVTPTTDAEQPPLVVPYSAALVTGTRAIVYVQLPNMPSFAEPAFQTLSAVIQGGQLENTREAFTTYGRMLDRPYDQPGTDHAQQLWNKVADQLGQRSLAGQRIQTTNEAQQLLDGIETVMKAAREQFAPQEQPTFEGREIVLGPRAGDYYLVRNGLANGELVVTQGNFKIDSEIQIQAKPSMMTPEGGGGGGHDHGGGPKRAGGDEHAGHKLTLPADFNGELRDLDAAFERVAQAVALGDGRVVPAAFSQFGEALDAVNGELLTGHPRMLWKEFGMLLGNDVVEGRDATQLAEADRVFLLLKGHMRRMREQLGVAQEPERQIDYIVVESEFQAELAKLWRVYLPAQRALAADDFGRAQQALAQLASALAAIDERSLKGHAQHIWIQERTNLTKLLAGTAASQDIKAMRSQFKPLSEEIGVLAKTFGFGASLPVYELHCPMAFQGQGAVWYQDDDQAQNPYYGSTMLKCADRVDRVANGPPQTNGKGLPEHDAHKNHSQH